MATYATAGLAVQRCRDENCPSGCQLTFPNPTEERETDGSATLTSYTRLMTAHHVSANYESIRALFGQPYLSPDIGAVQEEVDYLLAQRLWSIGLIDFAVNSDAAHPVVGDLATRREELRNWEYRPSWDGNYYAADSLDLQGLSPRSARALVYNDDNVQYEATLYGPGILFGHVPPHTIDDSVQGHVPLLHEEPLWSTQYVKVPTNWMSPRLNSLQDPAQAQWRSILSRPGYSAAQGSSLTSPCISLSQQTDDPLCTWSGYATHPDWPTYSGCYKTSSDNRPGSSGGVVLTTGTEYGVEGSPLLLRGIGSVHGASDVDVGWDPVVSELYPNDEDHNLFTAIPVDIAAILGNDFSDGQDYPHDPHGGPLGTVEIYQPGSGVPQGCDPGTDPDCRNTPLSSGEEAGAEGREDLVPKRCQDAIFPQVSQGSPTDARVAQAYAVGVMGETSWPLPLGNDRFDVFIDAEPERFLSTFEMVCAPWSEAQWTVHWQDLKFLGWERPGALNAPVWSPDALQRLIASPYHAYFGTNLSHFLPTAYEIHPRRNFQISEINPYWYDDYAYVEAGSDLPSSSGERHDLLRPLSMQLCPAGFALEGLDLITRSCSAANCREQQAQMLIRGVQAIECVNVPYDDTEPHEAQTITVPTSPDVVVDPRIGNLYDNTDFRYEFGDRTVQVEQQLGTPIYKNWDPNEQLTFVSCGPGTAVASMASNAHSLQTTAVDLIECIPLPRL